jgi:hypothetical protein
MNKRNLPSDEQEETDKKLVIPISTFIVIKIFLILLATWPDRTGSKPGKPVTRYTCLACPRSCVLYVKGRIIRIRQLCLQFKKMDGFSLWTRQDKP